MLQHCLDSIGSVLACDSDNAKSKMRKHSGTGMGCIPEWFGVYPDDIHMEWIRERIECLHWNWKKPNIGKRNREFWRQVLSLKRHSLTEMVSGEGQALFSCLTGNSIKQA